jgi:hypothetical protein
MEYRVAGYRYTPANTVSQINEARGWLFDRNQSLTGRKFIGGLLALDGRMGEKENLTATPQRLAALRQPQKQRRRSPARRTR